MPITIVTICGSVRPNSYTGMALAVVHDELAKHAEIETHRIDLAEVELAFPGRAQKGGSAAAMKEAVAAATGVIIATPEYHGGFSSVVKLAIENLGFPSVLASKPMALLGVAAGQIGAIKSLEQLRSVCSHVGAMVLPSFVSVPGVREVFDANGHCSDPRVERRIRSVATTLIEYIHGAVCPKIALEAMLREETSR